MYRADLPIALQLGSYCDQPHGLGQGSLAQAAKAPSHLRPQQGLHGMEDFVPHVQGSRPGCQPLLQDQCLLVSEPTSIVCSRPWPIPELPACSLAAVPIASVQEDHIPVNNTIFISMYSIFQNACLIGMSYSLLEKTQCCLHG